MVFISDGSLQKLRLTCAVMPHSPVHMLFLKYLKLQNLKFCLNQKVGTLRVFKEDGLIFLDFPSADIQPVMQENNIYEALSSPSILSWSRAKDDFLLEFSDEISIKELSPDFQKISQTEARGVIVTSQSSEYDFVCRFFAPRVGINEDPVTGSAFTKLIPFWSKKLNKEQLFAKQISDRGGEVNCKFKGERVFIGGNASVFLKGRIEI